MSASDPYLHPNGVLRNKLGIQDRYELLAYEKDFVVTRYIDLKKQRECPDAKRAVSRRGISLFNALLHALQGISPLERIIRKESCSTSVFIAIALSPDSSERNNLLHAAEER